MEKEKEKRKHGVLIYQPGGPAAEYCTWACNLYNGCSNRCDYCYNRHSRTAKIVGKDTPTVKRGMSPIEAYRLFRKELERFRQQILDERAWLHFSFVSDPCLPETERLNYLCIRYALKRGVPVQILTKMDFLATGSVWQRPHAIALIRNFRKQLRFGFTLTGHDELEPGASPNKARIECMRRLKTEYGAKTWASIEPVISVKMATEMIEQAWEVCDEFRIGILHGKKPYTTSEIFKFFVDTEWESVMDRSVNIIWKKSLLDYASKHIPEENPKNHEQNKTTQ